MTLRCVFSAHAAATHAPFCANRMDIDDGSEDLLNFTTTLPEKEIWLRCDCVKKRTADDTFVTRRCVRAHIHMHEHLRACMCAHSIVTRVMHAPRLVITDRSLFFAHENDNRVLDDILLHEVCLLLGCISQPVNTLIQAGREGPGETSCSKKSQPSNLLDF